MYSKGQNAPSFFFLLSSHLLISTRADELPAVDVFVTTADPELEPPVVTVNTVLSLLAVDYPAGKLACYVSDDGGSPLTCYALREAAAFARLWVPFCRRHGVGVRAPSVYFSALEPRAAGQEFWQEWAFIKVRCRVVRGTGAVSDLVARFLVRVAERV
jgi:hypothetical protein